MKPYVLSRSEVFCPNCHEPMVNMAENMMEDEADKSIFFCENSTCGWVAGPDMILNRFFKEYNKHPNVW